MKYESAATVAMNKNIKKAQNKIGFVGALYFIGALAMLALSCLIVNLEGKTLWMADFWAPITNIFKKNFDILKIIVIVLYVIMILSCLVRFLKCFGLLGWLSKRVLKYVDGYDRNLKAMDALGRKFSASFASIVCISLLIALIQPPTVKVEVGIFAYATLGVGLLIHFFAGVLSCGLNYYSRGADNKFREEKRPYSVFVYFFRNLMQVLATAAIVFFFVKNNAIGAMVESLLAKNNPFAGDLMKNVIPVVLDLVLLICIFVLITHATNVTEYNLDGIFGKGMKNYRVFAFLTVLVSGGAYAVDILAKIEPVSKNSLIIAIIAFVIFLIDCIFKSKHRQETFRGEVEEDEVEEVEEVPAQQNSAATMQTINNYYGYPYGEQAGAPTAQSCQPIYIPIYQPWGQPVEKPAQTEEEIELEAFDIEKRWEVKCPYCGKLLTVRDVAEYHRCPICQKVFVVRVKERMDVKIK